MNASRLCLAALVALLLTSVDRGHSFLHAGQAIAAANEELIAEKDPSCRIEDDEDVPSPDGRMVAWRAPAGQQWSVMLNGVRQGGAFDEVRALRFSLDGKHFAFAARRDKRWLVVLDGKEAANTYEDIRGPVFSPAGDRVAYTAKRDRKWTIVENGKEGGPTYSDAAVPGYSEDGRHLAFRAKPVKKWVLVVDGEAKGAEFDDIVVRRFSRDGERVAWVGRRGDKHLVVVDGKEGPSFDIVGGIGFSSDGRRFAYAGADVRRGFGKQKAVGRTVVDETMGPEFEGEQVGSLLKNMATGSTPHLVVGYFPDLLSSTHGVTSPVFSPDGRRVAYAARQGKDASVTMMNGEAGAPKPSIVAGPIFSPDGQHVAIVVSEGGALSLVVDGAKVGGASTGAADFVSDVVYAPDNRRVAYIGVNGGDWYERGYTHRARRRVYVNGVADREYDAKFLARLQFTPDGRHVVYQVGGLSENSRDVTFVVLDGVEGKRYDNIFGPVRFDPDGRSIAYTAQSGRKFYAVRQPLISTTTGER